MTSSSGSSTSMKLDASWTRCASGWGVCAVVASREDPAHRVRTVCGGTPPASRVRQAGNLQLPWLHLRVRQDSIGQIPDQTEHPAGSHASEAAGDQGEAAPVHARADPRSGEMAETGRPRLLQLLRSTDQRPCTRSIPAPCHRPLAAHATATQPKGSDHVGTDDAAGGRLAPETDYPSSLAKRPLCRQAPEVGAVCGKAARTALCGGREVTRVPTASREKAKLLRCMSPKVAAWPPRGPLWPRSPGFPSCLPSGPTRCGNGWLPV